MWDGQMEWTRLAFVGTDDFVEAKVDGTEKHGVVAGRPSGERGHEQAWLRQLHERLGNPLGRLQKPSTVA